MSYTSKKNQQLSKMLKRSRANWIPAVVFLTPALLFLTYSVYIPFIWNFILSFQKWDGFMQKEWVGIQNFTKALHNSGYLSSLKNSVFLAVTATGGAVLTGLILALLIYKITAKEGAVYRLILFIPVMLPSAIVGLLFTFVFNYDMGILNSLLRVAGLDGMVTAWLENKNTVMWSISFVGMWKMSGLTMMLTFASIQMLPDSLFESARIEGATYLHQIIHIIIPLIRPIITLSLVYTLVVNFKTYDLVYVMTHGGPGTISQTVPLLMVKTAFQFNKFGYASAMGVILTVVVMCIVAVSKKLLNGETYEY